MREQSSQESDGLSSAAVAAHELKTPLALIRQLSLLVSDEAADSKEVRKLASQLTLASERALGLVGDLAQTANLGPSLFPLEPVNPLAVCQQLALEVRPLCRLYGHNVKWPRNSARRQLVVANRTLLMRILANFLDNSLKYSEKGIDISVEARRIGDTMRLGVRDFGPMMSRAEYRRLTDELSKLKSVKTRPESSGLGVYIASRFAEAMGGKIGLIRHRDGLTFYVDMPLSEQMSLL